MIVALMTARFMLEIALLTSLAIAGWQIPDGTVAQVLLAAALPIGAGFLWGMFIAPRARYSAPLGVRITIELLLFGSAAIALWFVDVPVLAVSLVVGEAIVLGSLLVTGNPPGRPAVVRPPQRMR